MVAKVSPRASNLKREESKMTFVTKLVPSIMLVLLALVCIRPGCASESEPSSAAAAAASDSAAASAIGSPDDQFSSQPKRRYFIAPRVGRSAGPRPASIWSSLEEASLLAPGQLQATRSFPGPLRSSLLFLIGADRRAPGAPARHLIGVRSSGLLPQARIGRRASPSGLLPQPRVGRRSDSHFEQLFDEPAGADDDEQPAPVAEALEALEMGA